MSPLLFQPDAAELAFLCQKEVPRRHRRLVLLHVALKLRHPQEYPRRQMLPEKPYAPYR
jgi:hypothetical protein